MYFTTLRNEMRIDNGIESQGWVGWSVCEYAEWLAF